MPSIPSYDDNGFEDDFQDDFEDTSDAVSYTHLTLPTTPYV